MAPVRTRAVLLRSHDYGDTSRILRFLTEDHGMLSAVAKGVRGRTGKGTATLATFASGDLTVYVKAHRDLHTMKDFEGLTLRSALASDVLRFAGASALAELVLAHAEQEPHPGLFAALQAAFDGLEQAAVEDRTAAVLSGLWSITGAFGFAPEMEACVRCGAVLGESDLGRFDFAAGGIRCPDCSEGGAGPRMGPGARGQVRRLLQGEAPADLSHERQHLVLLSDFLAYHVVSKPLKSVRFLEGLLPAETGSAS